jgi:hypothetical protein
MKLAALPNCAAKFDTAKLLFRITAIGLHKLVTNEIITNNKYITTMGRRLDFFIR